MNNISKGICQRKVWYCAWSQSHNREYYWTTLEVEGADGETFTINSRCQWVMPDNVAIASSSSLCSALGSQCIPYERHVIPLSGMDRDEKTVAQKAKRIETREHKRFTVFILITIVLSVVIGGACMYDESSFFCPIFIRVSNNQRLIIRWCKRTFSSYFDLFFAPCRVFFEGGNTLHECLSETDEENHRDLSFTLSEQSSSRSFIAKDLELEMTSVHLNDCCDISGAAALPINKSKDSGDKTEERTFHEDASFRSLQYNPAQEESTFVIEQSLSSETLFYINDGDDNSNPADKSANGKLKELRSAEKGNTVRKMCFVPLFYFLSEICRLKPPFQDLENILLQSMIQ